MSIDVPVSSSEQTGVNRTRKKETNTLTPDRLLEAFRGYRHKERQAILGAHWDRFTATEEGGEQLRAALKAEGCSDAFIERMIQDDSLRERVLDVCDRFEMLGERFQRLEEAEVYLALVETGREDVRALTEGVSFEGKFAGMRDLKPEELRYTRLRYMNTMAKEAAKDPSHLAQYAELGRAYQRITGKAAKEEELMDPSWHTQVFEEAVRDPEAMTRLVSDPVVKEFYEMLHGQRLDTAHRRIQLRWGQAADGSRIPRMLVEGKAVPEKADAKNQTCSVLSFVIEGRQPDQEGHAEQRVLKDIVVKIDAAQRGKNEGIKFLLDKLPLTKKFKIQEVQFNANIRIGSYAWRFADMDVREMASQNFDEEEWNEIGGRSGWDEEKAAKAERLVMTRFVLPVYEEQFYKALGLVPAEVRKEHAGAVRRLEQALEEIKKNAELGVVTMEDLADLGRDEPELFQFDKDGNQTSVPSEIVSRGHMGKAAIMGLPWYASIKTDRVSLSRVIDKLYKGSRVKSLFMKAGLALFH